MIAYAGIGSRETPVDVLSVMRGIARRLAQMGYTLRSGGANGADLAFEQGCDAGEGVKEIYLPSRGFNGSDSMLYPPSAAAMASASAAHPNWAACHRFARLLHARNCHQVLGGALDCPAAFVVCWTRDGAESESERSRQTGGTGQAITLASRHGIPVINLARPDAMERLKRQVEGAP